MKNLFIIFGAMFLTGYVFTTVTAKQSPKIDELDVLMSRIQKNLEMASEATKMAQKMSEQMVEKKVEEKEQLKEAIIEAETKAEIVVEQLQKVEEKVEFYQVKMIGSGVDTAFQEVQFGGPIYEAFLNYVEEGGKEDFEYFRLYIWQQK
jgi:hypothetical protein